MSDELSVGVLAAGAAVLAALVAMVATAVSAILVFVSAERRTAREFKTDFVAERVAYELLKSEKWNWRTFEVLKHHLGGFDDNELRKILVRSGAIRAETKAGVEVWGLLTRVKQARRKDKRNERESLTYAPITEPEKTIRIAPGSDSGASKT